jgi:hypothetical protein
MPLFLLPDETGRLVSLAALLVQGSAALDAPAAGSRAAATDQMERALRRDNWL